MSKPMYPQAPERWLILARHAQAGDAERFFAQTGQPDYARPLTRKGYYRAEAAALGLQRWMPRIDHIWSSPWRRAEQTAALFAAAYKHPHHCPEALEPPWAPVSFSAWLETALVPGQIGLCVGHQPDLSHILDYWLCGNQANCNIPMAKGSVCILRTDTSISPGQLRLWYKLPQEILINFDNH